MDRPSILASQLRPISASGLRSVSRSRPRRTRSMKPCSSSSVKALSSDSIGRRCVTLVNVVVGAGATRCVGLNMSTSCGNLASIAFSRWRSLSYSASEISGASFS